MLGSAVLRTLAQVKAGLVWIHPHTVGMVWYQVRLSSQTGHPKAVIRICGKQREESRGRVRRVAYRDVQFIRGHYFKRWISILPPELVPDYGDFQRIAWAGGVLDARDYTR